MFVVTRLLGISQVPRTLARCRVLSGPFSGVPTPAPIIPTTPWRSQPPDETAPAHSLFQTSQPTRHKWLLHLRREQLAEQALWASGSGLVAAPQYLRLIGGLWGSPAREGPQRPRSELELKSGQAEAGQKFPKQQGPANGLKSSFFLFLDKKFFSSIAPWTHR